MTTFTDGSGTGNPIQIAEEPPVNRWVRVDVVPRSSTSLLLVLGHYASRLTAAGAFEQLWDDRSPAQLQLPERQQRDLQAFRDCTRACLRSGVTLQELSDLHPLVYNMLDISYPKSTSG